jgi:hypothetical protein
VNDLAEFLLARIAEDRAEVPADRAHEDYGTGFNLDSVTVDVSCARWLTECDAKRRIVERASHDSAAEWHSGYTCGAADGYDDILRLLALPYADHSNYREDWRV